MRVVASEPAIDALMDYGSRSPAHAERLNRTLAQLDSQGRELLVIRLEGSDRPVWCERIDDATTLYFVVGAAAGERELRIVEVAAPPDGACDLRLLLFLIGDVRADGIPPVVTIRERASAMKFPARPAPFIPDGSDLQACIDSSPNSSEVAELGGEDDLNGRRYRVFTHLDRSTRMPLRLSPQQERMLLQPLPLLMQGVAGCGKTTIAAQFAHRFAQSADPSVKVLLLVYTDELQAFTTDLLEVLNLPASAPSPQIEVKTWRKLCGDLASSAGIKAMPWVEDRAVFEMFKAQTRDAALAEDAHEYVVSYLKGGHLKQGESAPGRMQILAMRETPLDERLVRTGLVDLVEQYQSMLSARGQWDDADAARALLEAGASAASYDYVIVDEAQDYTLVQLTLFANLARSVEGLVFAGDSNQVLYRSQFSWDSVRQAIWSRWNVEAPAPLKIDHNYRNSQPVNDLANGLLALRSRRLELKPPERSRSNQAMTPRPLRVAATRAQSRVLLDHFAQTIGSLAVVSGELGALEQIGGIVFSRGFTPRMVKGLEFNVVCLVDFESTYQHLLHGSARLSWARRTLAFNEIYVAITRSRAQLVLIDTSRSRQGLWSMPELVDLVDEAESVDALKHLVAARFENRTSAQWEQDAKDLERQKAFAAAGECWERAGKRDEAARCYEAARRWSQALDIHRMRGDMLSCARIARKLGKPADAARYLEEGGLLLEAAEQWLALKQPARAAAILARSGQPQKAAELFEQAKMWSLAAEQWMRVPDRRRAAAMFEKAQAFDRALEAIEPLQDTEESVRLTLAAGRPLDAAAILAGKGDAKRAATLFEEAGAHLLAAQQWCLAGERVRAATQYEAVGEFDKALEVLGDTGPTESRVRLLTAVGRRRDAASILVGRGEAGRAASLFEEAGAWPDAGEQWMRVGDYARAATAFQKAGNVDAVSRVMEKVTDLKTRIRLLSASNRHLDAGRLLAAAGEHGQAAKSLERAQAWRESAEQSLLASDFQNAAMRFERGGMRSEAIDAARRISDWKARVRLLESWAQTAEVASLYAQAGKPRRAAELFEAAGAAPQAADQWVRVPDYRRAARQYELANDFEHAIAAMERVRDGDEVLRLMMAAGRHADAARRLADAGKHDLSAAQYEVLGDLESAAEQWARHGNRVKASELFELAGDFARALAAIRDTDDVESIARLLEKLGQQADAATVLADATLARRAAEMFESAGMWAQAAGQWMLVPDFACAATDFEKAGDLGQAIDASLHTADVEETVRLQLLAGRVLDAASLLGRSGQHRKAAELFESQGAWMQAAELWHLVPDDARAASGYRNGGDLSRALEALDRERAALTRTMREASGSRLGNWIEARWQAIVSAARR